MIISAPLTFAPHVTESMSVVVRVFGEQLPLRKNPPRCCVAMFVWLCPPCLCLPEQDLVESAPFSGGRGIEFFGWLGHGNSDWPMSKRFNAAPL